MLTKEYWMKKFGINNPEPETPKVEAPMAPWTLPGDDAAMATPASEQEAFGISIGVNGVGGVVATVKQSTADSTVMVVAGAVAAAIGAAVMGYFGRRR